MNILYVSELSNLGGGETSLLNLMLEFKYNDKKINPILLCFNEGKLTKESKENNIKTIIYDINSKIKNGRLINVIKNIKNIMREENIEVVQTNEWKTAVIVSFINKILFLKCKVIWICHGQWYKFNFIKQNLINIFIDNIIAVSRNVKNNLYKNNIKSDKIKHIPLGIHVEKFNNGDKDKIRREKGISNEEVVFAVIGRFQEIKGQKLVIEAVKKLSEKEKKCKILFVGDSIFNNIADDIYKKECLDLIKQYSIEGYFEFLGVRRDINDILKGIDALIVPSINESFGMVIIEAFASGCNVISTSSDGATELIKNHKTGYLLNSRDPKELCEIICKFIDNSKEIKIKSSILEQQAIRYDIENITNEYLRIYKN